MEQKTTDSTVRTRICIHVHSILAIHVHVYTCIKSTKEGEKDNPEKQDTYDTDQTSKTCNTQTRYIFTCTTCIYMYMCTCMYYQIIKGHLGAQPGMVYMYVVYMWCTCTCVTMYVLCGLVRWLFFLNSSSYCAIHMLYMYMYIHVH